MFYATSPVRDLRVEIYFSAALIGVSRPSLWLADALMPGVYPVPLSETVAGKYTTSLQRSEVALDYDGYLHAAR